MANFGFKTKPQEKKIGIGLDMGSSSIKVIELSADAGNNVISACGFRKIAGLSRQEVSDTVKDMFDRMNFSSREVNISVSGSALIVRFIQLPRMDRESLKGAIRFEAEKFIPFDINDCVIDFQVMSENDKDKKQNILFVAVKKDLIKERMKIAEDAGLSINIIDVDNFAMANSFFANLGGADPGKTRAVMNMGASVTNMCILRDGTIHFVRDILVGSNDLTAAIAKRMGIDKAAAEVIKISPKDKAAEVTICVKTVLGSILDEVKLSFGYYENQCGRSVDEIYVSGGGSGMIGLADVFNELFGTSPSVWNPLGFLGQVPAGIGEGDKSSFAVAAGLALR